jgi:4-pyridoxate dehydrogenase
VEPLVDLPVGRNLQDHLAVFLAFARAEPGPFHHQMRLDRMAVSMLQAWLFGAGPGTVVPGGLHAFIKTRPDLAVPDIEFMFRGAAVDVRLWFPLIMPPRPDGFAIRPTLLHPDSRGEILLRSADPREPMRIAYNFFTAPGDLPKLREGFRLAREIAYQKPLDRFRGAETAPGAAVKSDAELEAYIRRTALTAHHPAATCPMGAGPDAVLDAQMRVRGVERLRVVDASAMPDIISAHLNAAVMMMAEKAADMISGKPPLAAAV